MLKIILTLIACYFFLVLFIYFFQNSLIYLPDHHKPILNKQKMAGMHEVILHTNDGLSLLSWYKAAQTGKPTILYLQGNAGNIALRNSIVKVYIKKGYGVLLLGYRGYGGNPGRPSEEGLYKDAFAGWSFLQNIGVPTHCFVLQGESLGSAVAVKLASQHQVGAIMLIAPFTSLLDIGRYHYWFLPVRFLLRDHFESLAKIMHIKAPLLVMLSESDSLIPAKFSRRLYNAANEPKELAVFKDLQHNELPNAVQDKVINFLTRHISCS